ncbi:MAG: hypothetical protein A2Z78_00105 [Candidatus Nealsonbacteria bacterium RBG_13_36_15]|uniref:Transposase IS200-like domain-containing protein n=1 Tax=Candidatus Nealsonbacteria bacterium RBG_13_36_15 TaxID=1801660 RepID=A0A1G2DVW5_9BACT|nr:MAG: hypothetical protein A2Z78_00105 [Candidatus Nealsonbacteria bacterium RBG_13_36_15]
MPYRQFFFEKHQPVHIISRAVEEREIFKEEDNCYRFIFQLYAANVGKPALNLWRQDIIKSAKALLQGEDVSSRFIIKEHPPLVNFLDFCLVVNHYHFQLVPNSENSIPQYMKKVNGGFAKYFNLKHNRRGALFGSRYKSVPIRTDFQSDAVTRYISVINVLDVYQPGWREKGLHDWEGAFKFLEDYQFSSFPDRIGKRNSKLITPETISEKPSFEKYAESKKIYSKFVQDFLENKLTHFSSTFLE